MNGCSMSFMHFPIRSFIMSRFIFLDANWMSIEVCREVTSQLVDPIIL